MPRGRDDDDRPQRRRRDDDDDRPRSRRRREEEDDDHDYRPRRVRRRGAMNRSTLRTIAILQKLILGCLAAYVLLPLAAACLVPVEFRWLAQITAIPILIGTA